MKTVIYPVLVILVALISVLLSEISMKMWLENISFDTTGSFFWSAIIPAELIVIGVTTLVLMAVYKHKPRLYMPLYAATFSIAHAIELNALGNPWADAAMYIAGILLACGFWFALLARFYIAAEQE